MKSVKVIFKDSKYNYTTSVNEKATDNEIRRYFIGQMFNIGCYPIENMQQCIDVEIE
jgi:hypothetical protein